MRRDGPGGLLVLRRLVRAAGVPRAARVVARPHARVVAEPRRDSLPLDRQAGYAHVVENEAEWNTDFGRETVLGAHHVWTSLARGVSHPLGDPPSQVEGLIEFDGAGIPLKRRPPLPFEEMRSRVVDFGKAPDTHCTLPAHS